MNDNSSSFGSRRVVEGAKTVNAFNKKKNLFINEVISIPCDNVLYSKRNRIGCIWPNKSRKS